MCKLFFFMMKFVNFVAIYYIAKYVIIPHTGFARGVYRTA